MSIIGAVGMFSSSIFQPIIGSWIDGSMEKYSNEGLTGNELQLAAGQETLEKMISFPAILIVLFIILFFWQRNSKRTKEMEVN